MTPSHAKELLPIITAFAEGKKIEYRLPGMIEWTLLLDGTFGNKPECYRIAKEHRYAIVGIWKVQGKETFDLIQSNDKDSLLRMKCAHESATDFVKWSTGILEL